MITIREQAQIRDYLLIDRLSETNMGQVWKAADLARNRTVALKMLRDDLVDDKAFRGRFLDETNRHLRLEHPNIVPVYDYFSEDNLLCLVMRYIEGPSLAQVLAAQNGKPLPLERLRRMSEQVLSALDYAHRNGIIHRDVKPSNILLDREDNAYLIDFGIALAVGDIRRTRIGGIVGTPLYMSPEQIRTPRQVDQRTDVYSYGCVLFEMATGRTPFQASDDLEGDFLIRQAHVTQPPPHPKRLNPGLPDRLESIILAAMEKDPEKRIPGCGEFKRLLEQLERPEGNGKFSWPTAVVFRRAAVALLATLIVLGALAGRRTIVEYFVHFVIGPLRSVLRPVNVSTPAPAPPSVYKPPAPQPPVVPPVSPPVSIGSRPANQPNQTTNNPFIKQFNIDLRATEDHPEVAIYQLEIGQLGRLGHVHLEAVWQGGGELQVFLNRKGETVKVGRSPLRLDRLITSEDLASFPTWQVTVANKSEIRAHGTLTMTISDN
jgi:serine/threonine-protein kinase